MKKSKKTEAALQLNRIAKSLKTYHAEAGGFPVGKAALTPATGPCCRQPHGKCPVDAAGWQKSTVWSALADKRYRPFGEIIPPNTLFSGELAVSWCSFNSGNSRDDCG